MRTVDGASNLYGQLMEGLLDALNPKLEGFARLLGQLERLPAGLPGLQRVEAQV